MAIKDQCLRCKHYDANVNYCKSKLRIPVFDNTSCSDYFSARINLNKESENSVQTTPQNTTNSQQPNADTSWANASNSNPTPIGIKRYFSFEGRIGRGEYWISYLIYYLYCLPMNLIEEDNISGGFALIWLMLLIPMSWMLIAQGAKRCHDLGNSGWFQLIPFYGLWMLFAAGDSMPNQYGNPS